MGILLLLLFGGSLAVALGALTPHGLGVSPDSRVYLESAQNLLQGHGLTDRGQRVTHYPPGYPAALALAGRVAGGDVQAGAKGLQMLLYALNGMLLVWAAWAWSGRRWFSGALAAAVYSTAPAVFSVHVMAWSEPLFLTALLLALICLAEHLARPHKAWLVGAAVAVGFALITRYAAVALLPTLAMALLLPSNCKLSARIRDALAGGTIACLPLMAWVLSNHLAAGTGTNRQLVFHPVAGEHFHAWVNSVHGFAFPPMAYFPSRLLAVLSVLALFTAGWVALQRRRPEGIRGNLRSLALPMVCTLFAVLYLSTLLASLSFFDAHTPINGRILLPFFLTFLLALLTLPWLFGGSPRWLPWAFLLTLGLRLVLAGPSMVAEARDTYRHGDGYTATQWRQSATIEAVQELEDPRKIYTNAMDALRFWTHRDVEFIPRTAEATTRQPNPTYDEEMADLCRQVRSGEALLVYFRRFRRWYLPHLRQILDRCSLPVLQELEDGWIFGLPLAETRTEPLLESLPPRE